MVQLNLNQFLATDGVPGRDVAEIAVDAGLGFVMLATTADGSLAANTGGHWQPITVDLSQYSGQNIRLRFRFDSVDAALNQFEGWYVDDVQIRAANSYLADIDEYTLDLTQYVGKPLDFVVAAQAGGDLTGATVELLGPDGTTVVATASNAPLGVEALNFDQAILGYVPLVAGRYTLRIVANQPGEYGVLVTASLPFEAEPNDDVSGTLRNLNGTDGAVGYLGDGDQGGGGGSSRLFAIDTTNRQIVELDPVNGAELNRFAVPGTANLGGPDGLAYDGHSLFYATAVGYGGGTLYELDPDSGAIRDSDSLMSLGVSTEIDGLGAYGGLIFVMNYPENRIDFVNTTADLAVGSWIAPVDIVGGTAGAGARGSIFASNASNGTILELDADTGQVLNSFAAPAGASVYGLAYTNGSLYAGGTSGVVYELDPDNGNVRNSFVSGFPIWALGGDDASGTPPFLGPLAGATASESVDSAGSAAVFVGPYATNDVTTLEVELPGFDKNDPLASVVGNELAFLALSSAGGGAALAAYQAAAGAMGLVQIYENNVVIDAVAAADTSTLWNDLVELGLTHGSSFGRVVSGWLPIHAISDMAALASLRFAMPAYKPLTNIGATTSQADVSMQADVARSMFGVDGTGVTVGVLSDTYDHGPGSAVVDMLTGDLPGPLNPFGHTTPVNVLSDPLSGTNEGRAMLQLVHDVAPGADLAFHTASNGQADFANGILALQGVAGADVIVDDVIYFAEPMFQDGIIAQAINTVVANGATYFSSAGNNARTSWEGTFRPSGTFLSGRQLHDFDPGPGVDTFQSITVPFGETVYFSFQWDSPFFSVSGGSGSPNDLDFFVLDSTGTSILASATTNNLGGDAVEVVGFTNFSGGSSLNVAIGLAGGTAPNLMKWVGFGDPVVNEYATNSATAYGHSNAAGAVSVGAADYRRTPAFGVDPAQLEPFSSAGGIPILYDTSGTPIYVLRDKPQIVAPDGTNTTFFGNDVDGDGYPNFFGTSAAAPNAAAVAALMRQLAPAATPSEIYNALASSAIDMDDPATPGFDVGFDSGTGHGLIQAVNALTLVAVDPILVGPKVTNVNPGPGVTHDLSITSIELTFSEQLSTATANDAAAYQLIQAGPNGVFDAGGGDDVVILLTPLYDGATSVTLAIGNGHAPLGFGKYRLVVDGGGTLQDLDGNPLNSISGPGGGSDFVHDFEVVFAVPGGGDFYRLDLAFGQRLSIATETPWHDPLGALVNDLDAQLIVYDGLGKPVAFDSNSASDGRNALVSFVALRDGPYFVQVVAESGTGEYLLDVAVDDVVLLGDFNRDGAVNSADYTVWRDHLGQDSEPYLGADGDGDGTIGTLDYQVWKTNFGATFATARSDQFVLLGGGGAGNAAAEVVASDGAAAANEVAPPLVVQQQQAAPESPTTVLPADGAVVEQRSRLAAAFADFGERVVSAAKVAGHARDFHVHHRRNGDTDRGDLLAIVLDHDLRVAKTAKLGPGSVECATTEDGQDSVDAAAWRAADEFFAQLQEHEPPVVD